MLESAFVPPSLKITITPKIVEKNLKSRKGIQQIITSPTLEGDVLNRRREGFLYVD